jgi:hypothetical protein
MIFALGGVREAAAWWDFGLICIVNTSWFPWNVGTSHLLNSNTACESGKKWGVTEIFSLLHIYVFLKKKLFVLLTCRDPHKKSKDSFALLAPMHDESFQDLCFEDPSIVL